MSSPAPAGDPVSPPDLPGVVGQPAVGELLRASARRPHHAYLFVGPPGTGKTAAARAFAAMLICPNGGGDQCGVCARVETSRHPDFMVVEREGASLTIDQAREVTRIAARSSVEGGKSVVVLPDLHLAEDSVPALLKTIEEPAGPVVFIGLAEYVPPELATIASRCVRVDFRPLSDQDVIGVLVAEGASPERAAAVASLAGGRLDRARLLISDPGADDRQREWASLPARLDGSGATAAVLADELVELLGRSTEPLTARQQREVSELVARRAEELSGGPGKAAQAGARGAGRELEERHKREQRRQRTDELRAGLASLARAYRDRAVSGALSLEAAAASVELIDSLSADLAYNPGEHLALEALLLRLDRLAG